MEIKVTCFFVKKTCSYVTTQLYSNAAMQQRNYAATQHLFFLFFSNGFLWSAVMFYVFRIRLDIFYYKKAAFPL